MEFTNDGLRFSTGKEIYCSGGIVGIDPENCITQGSDSGLDEDELTPEERVELAEFMIARWKQYSDQARSLGNGNT